MNTIPFRRGPLLQVRMLPALLVLAGSATAQLSQNWGPELAPIGCAFHFNMHNDGPTDVFYDPCGFGIFDAAGVLVYVPPCPGVQVLPVGGTYVWLWPQTDSTGVQVPPGTYSLLQFGLAGGIPIQVGGSEAAITPLGSYKIGTANAYEFCAPLDGGQAYLAALSGSSGSIPTCGGALPLAPDGLFFLSIGGTPLFPGFAGVLDASGKTQAPTLAIPADPVLAGLNFVMAFAVLDLTATCPVRRVSAPLSIVLF